MSSITAGDGGSFSSGNTAGEEVQQEQQQELVNHSHGSNSLVSSTSNGSSTPQDQLPPPAKKKRNLPGTPDPNAEVIALSPKSLLATNRFVCEICKKGFQRDQNLQLHRRGHNLPWKLRQRTSTEIRKRVYVCPEPSCVHHNPARALGDLTGIKKHFCRKHGEKKWKCDKCSKKYAVQSDWKAHSKTCGTKEYKCDCGTIFSRRDSFITHRAFCDALTEENSKASQGLVANLGSSLQAQVPDQLIPAIPNTSSINVSDIPFSYETKSPLQPLSMAGSMFSNSPGNLFGGTKTHVPNSTSSCLQLNANSSTLLEGNGHLFSGSASMSATALLQKAAQMGATASTGSLNSPLMGKSFTTSMAPPSFVSMHTQNNNQSQVLGCDNGFTNQFMQKISQQDIQSELFTANAAIESIDQSSAVNNMGMFSGVFDQNNALLKGLENDQHGASSSPGLNTTRTTGLPGFGGDMMTVDFLGIGGSRTRSLLEKQQQQHQQQQDLDQFGGNAPARLQGLSHFQQHAALEKPMWKV